MRNDLKLKMTLGKVCGSCAVASNIPIDMSKGPGHTNCDECQGHVRTYRRTDNEEKKSTGLPDLTVGV